MAPNKKIGFDFHGVLDKHPILRSICSTLTFSNTVETHIITGEEDTPALRQKLSELNIHYNVLFSIISFHKSIGTNITLDKNGNPWMDPEIWNRTKADYCKRMNIDIHVDDSMEYGRYFETPFLLLRKMTV